MSSTDVRDPAKENWGIARLESLDDVAIVANLR
jgi:hypothetical protein